jgi:hypothetical protein
MKQKLVGSMGKDARILAGVTLAVLLIIIAGAFFAPARVDTDPTPTTYSSGSAGAKGAYLLLAQLGYRTERLAESADALDRFDPAHTTLILADAGDQDYRKDLAPIAAFLDRGGHILATGTVSAMLLPEPHIAQPNRMYTALCYTTPQGLSPLARAGRIATDVPVRWSAIDANTRIDQACGDDAVVVRYRVGKGEVIWWSSARPLSNRGLKEDSSLKLLLASVGKPGSTVVFDEYIHGARRDLWATAAGTPVFAMGWQLAVVALLLVLSFGRRNGPIRAIVSSPRTSPLEFAESMGDLYRKAGAVDVATGCAERRLLHFLETQGGIHRATLRSTPEAIASAVAERFRYRAVGFSEDLKAAREAEFNKLGPKSALELVQRIDRHIANLTALMRNSQRERNPEQPHGEPRD